MNKLEEAIGIVEEFMDEHAQTVDCDVPVYDVLEQLLERLIALRGD